MSLFTKAPHVFNIPQGVPFVDAFARGLMEHFPDPDDLANLTLLLPNRRAARALSGAFLRLSDGHAMILPRMHALGDVDEDDLAFSLPADAAKDMLQLNPAIGEQDRLIMLTKLVLSAAPNLGHDDMTMGQAARLAKDLAAFLDEVQIERIDISALKDLAPEAFAAHWQQTLKFLSIVIEIWPQTLEGLGLMDPMARRNRLMEILADHWRTSPPDGPVIAAGSTGSMPATADLMKVVCHMPEGALVLPGLDDSADDETWGALSKEATHPQYPLARLLAHVNISRDEVRPWSLGQREEALLQANMPRVRFAREALRPAETLDGWTNLTFEPTDIARDIRLVECPTGRGEAGVIALKLREALEEKGRTAALITPDRNLARRVKSELSRWNIEIDDSAGEALMTTPPGALMRLIAQAVEEQFAPIPLLALLKHPLVAGGMGRGYWLNHVRALENPALRGTRPAAGLKGLKRALPDDELHHIIDQLQDLTQPLTALYRKKTSSLNDLIAAHIQVAEALCATDKTAGADILWSGENGEGMARFLEGLIAAADPLNAMPTAEYGGFFEQLMAGHVVRRPYGAHPRLFIWGTIEARLQSADTVVLGGLNEASWPPDVGDDPWMSRPMREAFGLPPLERRIGLSAHDFIQSLGAKDVLLTRAEKIDGTPIVPSRWISRMKALGPISGGNAPWHAIYEQLDNPSGEPTPCKPPAPCPPVADRPQKLSVTRIEKWMSNPYDIYASYLLRLRKLDEIDQDPGPAEKGNMFHDALDQWAVKHGNTRGDDALKALLDEGKKALKPLEVRPGVWNFWWPRFEQVAHEFVTLLDERDPTHKIEATEIKGEWQIKGTARPFTLTATADRIDWIKDQKAYSIIDYKTGSVPEKKRILAGYASQMPLEMLMLEEGAFKGLNPAPVGDIEYWRISGSRDAPIENKPIKVEWQIEKEKARKGLIELINAFNAEATPYLSNPKPRWVKFDDFRHLARVDEWMNALPVDEGVGPVDEEEDAT
ncbi:MAG: double-strand break repair protein AddB [Sphingomonadales bacterium]|nr:double-strand break repair protein AddB [Sphingomonadales bacterium]